MLHRNVPLARAARTLVQALCLKGQAYISQVAQRIIDNLLPCIDDRRVEHRVLVQGRLGALHKADLEPIICSLMLCPAA